MSKEKFFGTKPLLVVNDIFSGTGNNLWYFATRRAQVEQAIFDPVVTA